MNIKVVLEPSEEGGYTIYVPSLPGCISEGETIEEVLSDNTFLVRLDTDGVEDADEDEALMMSLFLDFLMKDAIKNPSKLVPYTKKMSDEMDELLADVIVES